MVAWIVILLIFAVGVYVIIHRQMFRAGQNNAKDHLRKVKRMWSEKKPQQHKQSASLQQEQVAQIAADQLLFDQVAALLFEQRIHVVSRALAEQTQQRFLNKMPAKCLSQVGDYDLGEWSIYWSYQQQSLEYYVGRYGIFYTHVDRFGCEHKQEKKSNHRLS